MSPALLLAIAAMPAPQLPMDAGWELSGEHTRIERHAGRSAIRMRTGRAVRRDVSLRDGTIEFDVELTPRRSFVFVQFRIASDDEYEEIYFRPHKSSLPDAVQYAPTWKGESNWQLYHGANGTARYPLEPGRWMHVRLVLHGRQAALFLGDADTAAMQVTLAREPVAGPVAFASFVPDGTGGRGDEPAAAFATVVVRPGHVPARLSPAAADTVPDGLVTRWQLSPPFAASAPVGALADTLLRSRASWPVFAAEPTGVLVVGRHLVRPQPLGGTVARLVLRSSTAGLQPLQLGYSDYVTVFVDGRPLFAGDAHYSFDRPRQEGLIGLSQATVWIPVQPGDNEVLLALSDGFGGWGLMARVDPAGPARAVSP